MRKKLRLLASLLALGCSQVLWGFGLGDIEVESALNEPLVARIDLLNAAALTDRDVMVGIGSEQDYQVSGADRIFSHTNLSFVVRIDSQQNPHISITSVRPIREPFLNIVVQARWPQGKLVREYTLLLDLPVFTGATESESVQVAQIQVPQNSALLRASTSATTGSARTNAVSTPSVTSASNTYLGSEYRVQNGDTLWSLADRAASNAGVTRHQAMLSIRDLNPSAFTNGDLNVLKAGVVLRMPDEKTASVRSEFEAVAQFRSMQQRYGRAIDATPIRSISTNFREGSSGAESVGGRLALVSASGLGTGGSDDQSSNSDSQLVTDLENQNQVLKEELDKAVLENTDLSERLAALEEQLAVVGALLEIENNELANVQQGLDQVSGLDKVETAVTEKAVFSGSADDSELGLVRMIIGIVPYIGALIVLSLLVVLLVMKRRKSAADEENLFDDDPDEAVISEEGEPDSVEQIKPSDMKTFVVVDEEKQGDKFKNMDGLFANNHDDEGTEGSDSEVAESLENSGEDIAEETEEENDFDEGVELPSVDGVEESQSGEENLMAFDVDEPDLPSSLPSSDDIAADLEDDINELLADLSDEKDSDELVEVEISDDLSLDDLDASLSLDTGLDLDEDLDLGEDLLVGLGGDEDVASEDLNEEMNTKLELAGAYIEMGDARGAKELIDEVLVGGDDKQKSSAQEMADSIEGFL